MDPSICTIVSNNYLPFARVLARSFLEHHPQGRVWVLMVDRRDPAIDYDEQPFQVLFASDLGIPAFDNLAFRYSILELNTAVKPYLLEHLHRQEGCRAVCYLDPDILVTGDLSPLFDWLEDNDALLTPHILEPIEDDRTPSERDFLLSGIHNLGFLGMAFNARTLPFLRWWQDRLFHHCEHRVERGLFVDQKWMDFAPAFLDHLKVIRDPGYNVAYWNLMHRHLEENASGTGWTVSGHTLRFFHFSGIAWDQPDQVSKYQNRFQLRDRPDLEPLFRLYRERLTEEGIARESRRPYGYGHFDNGAPIPSVARDLVQLWDREGKRWAAPFSSDEPRSLYRWLLQPIRLGRRVRVPRLALIMWDLRLDLQRAFPSPLGRDAEALARWYQEEVRRRPDLDDRFALGVRVPPIPRPTSPPLPEVDTESPEAAEAGVDGNLLAQILAGRHGPPATISPEQARWLAVDVGNERRRRPWLPRLAFHAWRQREDLRSMFSQPMTTDRERFVVWFLTYGRVEYGLPRNLVAPVARRLPLYHRLYLAAWWLYHGRRMLRAREGSAAPPDLVEPGTAKPVARNRPAAPPEDRKPRVTVIGWVSARTGVGEACRGSLEALAQAEIGHNLWGLNHPVQEADSEAAPPSQDILHQIGLFHVNADMMEWVQHRLPLFSRTDCYRIGYWFWELSFFPTRFADGFRYVDEVWAPTRFCQRAYQTLAPVPVRLVPPAVRPPCLGSLRRTDLDLPEEAFLFLFLFDALSVPERKNPMGLLDAFERVLAGTDTPVHLALKVGHGDQDPDLLRTLEQRCRDLPVTLIRRSLSREDLSSLIHFSNAYVSLHRSEGLGLPIMEAMYLGRPVVTTGYGGCTDFVDETTAWPVDYRLVRLERDHGPYPSGAVWANPDTDHAAASMLDVLQQPEEVSRRCAAARRKIQETYAPAVVGRRFSQELERIERQLTVGLELPEED